MGFIKIASIIVLSLLLVALSVVSVTSLSLNFLLYPEVYQEVIEKNNVSQLIEEKAGSSLSLVKLPGNTQQTLNSYITEILAYARGEKSDINISLEINKEKIDSFFLSKIEALPACSEGQAVYSNKTPLCKPVDKTSQELLSEILEKNNLSQIGVGSINIVEIFDNENKRVIIPQTVKKYNYVLYGSLILSLLCILGISLLARISIKHILIAIGIPLLISSALIITAERISSPLLISQLSFLGPPFEPIAKDLASYLLNKVEFYSLILFAISIILIIASFFFHIRSQSNAKSKKKKSKYSQGLK